MTKTQKKNIVTESLNNVWVNQSLALSSSWDNRDNNICGSIKFKKVAQHGSLQLQLKHQWMAWSNASTDWWRCSVHSSEIALRT